MEHKNNWYNRKLIYLTAGLSFIVFGVASKAQAAAPKVARLAPVCSEVEVPTNVAVDSSGNVYVVDSKNDALTISSGDGSVLGTYELLSTPISVAVAGNGSIYVGNAGNGSVDVLNKDLSLSGKLGKGNGEFAKPGSIAIAANGDVYVTDGKNNVVKVYNSNRSLKTSFGEAGTGNGQFNFPTSIAINEKRNEVLVTDIKAVDGAYLVQAFSKAGNFLKGLVKYGQGEGELIRPLGIAVDEESRIYISDTLKNVVQVYDGNGNFLKSLTDGTDASLKTPMGLDFCSKTSRLFVASSNSSKVETFGIDDYRTDAGASEGLSSNSESGAQAEQASTTKNTAGNNCFISAIMASDVF